jgi:hypothetical protein
MAWVAISLGALGAALGALALWLDVRILQHQEHHHGLIREIHDLLHNGEER